MKKEKNSPSGKKGKILRHLQSGAAITQQIAIRRYGAYRLASTINRLRNEGYNIKTSMLKSVFGEPYASYTLEK